MNENPVCLLPGAGDAGRRNGPQRAGGAGVVPEPESQGENPTALLRQAANKSALRRVAYRRIPRRSRKSFKCGSSPA